MFSTVRTTIAVTALLAFSASAMAETRFERERGRHETSNGFLDSARNPLPVPPPETFMLVDYPSEVGPLGAYLTPDPGDGERHPAIIWLTGGRTNTLGEMWRPRPRSNDQSAAAYRQAGIVMMAPSLRGGNDNPGNIEIMYGEIDDILAAADYLAAQTWVDPERIYLGGHSVGGTTVFLVAEATDRFRAVFSFGPISDGTEYGYGLTPENFRRSRRERRLRSPIEWMDSVQTPLYAIEALDGNIVELQRMRDRNSNPLITFVPVVGENHFSVLAPVNEVIAQRILADSHDNAEFSLDVEEIHRATGSLYDLSQPKK